jgi:hypothetical protein
MKAALVFQQRRQSFPPRINFRARFGRSGVIFKNGIETLLPNQMKARWPDNIS